MMRELELGATGHARTGGVWEGGGHPSGRHAMMGAVWLALLMLAVCAGTVRTAPRQGDGAMQATLALGDSIFHGRVAGGLCATCHGPKGKGMPALGPDLTDDVWLHGDGSVEFIVSIVRTGVMKPKKSAAVMPPGGGSALRPEQLRAVAAYVHSLRSPGR